MSLELKININESKGLLSRISNKIKKSVTAKAITYGLAGSLALGGVGLSGCKSCKISDGAKEQKIAFISKRDGNDEIYVMNADGSGQTNLTNNPADDWVPGWSQ